MKLNIQEIKAGEGVRIGMQKNVPHLDTHLKKLFSTDLAGNYDIF